MKRRIGFVLLAIGLIVTACKKEEAQLSIQNLITDKVIEVAVASLAKDMGNPHFSYVETYGIIWISGVSARHAVFAEHLGKGWFDQVYYDRTDFRKRAMDLARESLDTPEELWAVYLAHKDKLVKEIKKHGLEHEVALRAQAILPHFRGDIVSPGPIDGRGVDGWIQRRHAEGGDALVQAYGDIVANLISSL